MWDSLWNDYPHILLEASGEAVGLPPGVMGNSEVGHLTLGSGRIIYQDLSRINRAIANGTFFENAVLAGGRCSRCESVTAPSISWACYLTRACILHLATSRRWSRLAMINGFGTLYIHAFTDGRDTSPLDGRDSR